MKRIGEHAFEHCYNLKNVILFEGLAQIRKFGFSWCDSMEHITIPPTVKSIGESEFSYCDKLTIVVNLSESLLRHNLSYVLACTENSATRIQTFRRESIKYKKVTSMWRLWSTLEYTQMSILDRRHSMPIKPMDQLYLIVSYPWSDINVYSRTEYVLKYLFAPTPFL